MADADGLQLVAHASRAQSAIAPADGQKKYVRLTPAMAIGVANQIFTEADLIRTPAYPQRVGDNHTCFTGRSDLAEAYFLRKLKSTQRIVEQENGRTLMGSSR